MKIPTNILKAFAVGATVILIPLQFLERLFSPSALLLAGSSSYPPWLGWIVFVLASVAPVAYIVIDVIDRAKEKGPLDTERFTPPEQNAERLSGRPIAQPERTEPDAALEPPPSTDADNTDALGERPSVS